MSVVVNEVIRLGQGFSSVGIDSCVVDGVKYAGVIKLIQAIGGIGDSGARSAWARMKEKHPDMEGGCINHKFDGKTGDVLVAEASTLMKIIFKLKGDRAQAFRESSMKAFLTMFNPTRELVETLQERLEQIEDGDEDGSVLVTRISRGPRGYGDTTIYVRVRVPHDHIITVVNPKQMTLRITKFGIAYSLHNRNESYMRDPDNGYMAFGFQCRSRQEAELVEGFAKYEYKDLTVLNSREYLDTERLADRLGVDFDEDSYESYMAVARTLFVRMIERLKLNFPGVYDDVYGTMYSIVATAQTGDETAVKRSYPAETITRELAAKFGFRTPKTTWVVPSAMDTVVPPPARTEQPMPAETDAQEPPADRRSKGQIIARDLVTGEEETFDSVNTAANRIGYTAKSLMRCVNAHRQMAGKHWRSPGEPHWVPPKGLQIVIAGREGVLHYVRGVSSDGVTRVYENPTVAALHQGVIARSVTQSANDGKPYNGVQWSWVQDSELDKTGYNVPTGHLVTVVTLPAKSAGGNGRCHGKVIQRDILTGEEVVHKSASYAARMNSRTDSVVTPKMMKDELVDKTRPANGRTFRSLEATLRWDPPTYYKRDPSNVTENWPNSSKNGKAQPWIVATDADGKVLALYETKLAASRIEGVPYDTIKTACDSGVLRHGRLWRSATQDEYGRFVQCDARQDNGGSDDSDDDV
jgi:hypothetical protein